jgi:23S rRNA (adenine2503-C2)-methyltransferase
MITQPTNLFSYDRAQLEALFAEMGEKRFRASQLMQWIYQRRVRSFDQMTDFSLKLRERLAQTTELRLPEITDQQVSNDGTVKWLFRLSDGNAIEAVYIPEEGRGTLCVSSQAGCALNCTFCATARQGYGRNLDISEIIGQLWLASETLNLRLSGDEQAAPAEGDAEVSYPREQKDKRIITNIVFMGMGEPLLNFDNVVASINLMRDDFSFGLSRRRVTLSTAGVVPKIDALREQCPISLAVSLHAANDNLRDQLVPLNRKYNIKMLLDACRRYTAGHPRQRVTFEYVMLEGINDSLKDARELVALLSDVPAKVNLIPFNPSPGIDYKCSSDQVIHEFRDHLLSGNIFTVTRKTRGDDIDAACGQLAGKIKDRTHRSAKLAQLVSLKKLSES